MRFTDKTATIKIGSETDIYYNLWVHGQATILCNKLKKQTCKIIQEKDNGLIESETYILE